jgi:hypothetical protein
VHLPAQPAATHLAAENTNARTGKQQGQGRAGWSGGRAGQGSVPCRGTPAAIGPSWPSTAPATQRRLRSGAATAHAARTRRRRTQIGRARLFVCSFAVLALRRMRTAHGCRGDRRSAAASAPRRRRVGAAAEGLGVIGCDGPLALATRDNMSFG